MYQRKFLRICKTMAWIWKHSLFQVHQVLVNQDLQRFGRRINIKLTARVSIQFILLNGKDGTYDFIDSGYRAQDVTIFDDIDATSFGFQEFLNVFDRVASQGYECTNRSWVSQYAIITKASRLEIGLRGSSKSNHQNMRKDKRVQEVQD